MVCLAAPQYHFGDLGLADMVAVIMAMVTAMVPAMVTAMVMEDLALAAVLVVPVLVGLALAVLALAVPVLAAALVVPAFSTNCIIKQTMTQTVFHKQNSLLFT